MQPKSEADRLPGQAQNIEGMLVRRTFRLLLHQVSCERIHARHDRALRNCLDERKRSTWNHFAVRSDDHEHGAHVKRGAPKATPRSSLGLAMGSGVIDERVRLLVEIVLRDDLGSAGVPAAQPEPAAHILPAKDGDHYRFWDAVRPHAEVERIAIVGMEDDGLCCLGLGLKEQLQQTLQHGAIDRRRDRTPHHFEHHHPVDCHLVFPAGSPLAVTTLVPSFIYLSVLGCHARPPIVAVGRGCYPPISGHAPAGALTTTVATMAATATASCLMQRTSRRRLAWRALVGDPCRAAWKFGKRPSIDLSLLEEFNGCVGCHRAPSGLTRGSRSWVGGASNRALCSVPSRPGVPMTAIEPGQGLHQKGQSRTKRRFEVKS